MRGTFNKRSPSVSHFFCAKYILDLQNMYICIYIYIYIYIRVRKIQICYNMFLFSTFWSGSAQLCFLLGRRLACGRRLVRALLFKVLGFEAVQQGNAPSQWESAVGSLRLRPSGSHCVCIELVFRTCQLVTCSAETRACDCVKQHAQSIAWLGRWFVRTNLLLCIKICAGTQQLWNSCRP